MLAYLAFIERKDQTKPGEYLNIFVRNQRLNARFSTKGNITTTVNCINVQICSIYYCNEHFSYIQSDIEKRIIGLMIERLCKNEQLVFTTHNTDMLDLNLPNHTFAFLCKEIDEDEYKVSVTFASEFLKRGTDSVKYAMENDVFGSLPDDS